ncbi:hypothetical protein D3C73_986590 [compost metagenome]
MERPDIGEIVADIIIQPLQTGDVLQLLRVSQQAVQNTTQCNGIVHRTVMALQQYFIFIRQCVQPVILHAREQETGQLQCIQRGVGQYRLAQLRQ